MKKTIILLLIGFILGSLTPIAMSAETLASRLAGKIILKVEDKGQAFYVHPDTHKLHYLRDGQAAYNLMRELSLGISNSDLATLADSA